MNRMFVWLVPGLLIWPLLLGVSGCAPAALAPLRIAGEPIGIQLLRAVPTLKEQRFSTLLDFESKDDEIFCSAVGGAGGISNEKIHTGHGAYNVNPTAKRLTIKLSSLLAGRPFPGAWVLVGGYFYTGQSTKITVRLDPQISPGQPREVDLPAGAWTAVFAELPAASAPQAVPALEFDFHSPHGSIWCDDVMLIDNFKVLTAPSDEQIAHSAVTTADVTAGIMPPWTITRRGLNYIGVAPARFDFELLSNQASPSGWIADEANPMRARFHSIADPSSPGRSLTVYSDGRAFWDGQYKPMSVAARDPVLESQHYSPAQIEVAEGMGRVDRNTSGDANNDGYNETTGAYRIMANGPRIELRFIPGKSPVLSPILEFSGLPFGKPLITLEGRLVEQSARTSDGTLLVELPAKIDRPVTVNVRIEE